MSKFSNFAVFTFLALASVAQAATNNGLSLFFDTRNAITTPTQWSNPTSPWKNEQHGGSRGDAQTVFVSPVIPSGSHIFGSVDNSNVSTFLYMDVDDRSGEGDVIASLGMDVAVQKDSGDMPLGTMSLAVFNSQSEIGGGATSQAWDDFTTVNGDNYLQLRAVRVPISGIAPVYNPELGLGVGGSYRLARVDIKGGLRGNLPASVGIYSGKIIVNDLLITRIYSDVGSTPELPDFGYFDGSPEIASVPGVNGANGSSVGTTSIVPDLTIVVKGKGDMNGDGTIGIADVTKFVQVFNSPQNAGVNQTWAADNDGNNVISMADVTGFVFNFNHWN